MTFTHRSGVSRPRGFSLIEIMVGLVLGMLAVIVIMQIFATAEASKRTTTAGGDAQINGAIALYNVERDIRSSGYGISAFNLLGCSLTYTTSGTTPAAITLNGSGLGPVTINPATSLVPAGDANNDTLLVMYGSSNSPSEGDTTSAVSSAGVYRVSTPSSFAVGDYIVATTAAPPSPCTLARDQVTAVSTATSTLTVKTGTTGLAINSVVYNLGQAFTVRAYAVRNGNLTVCDYTVNNCGDASKTGDAKVWVPADGNIVSMRAQYGHDTSGIAASTMSGIVDTFDQTTPVAGGGLSVYCSWARALAVRLVLVARSTQPDKLEPTTVAPVWAGSRVNTAAVGDPANATAVLIDLSSNAAWKSYRYKTVQTTVPLRNIVWQGAQSGC